MDISQFVSVMGALVLINDLVVQSVKTKITDKNTTLVAFVTSMILAFLGKYFDFYDFDIVTTIVVGLSVGLFGTSGYDKVRECYNSILLMLKSK